MKSLSFLKLAGAGFILAGGAVASAQIANVDPNKAAAAPVYLPNDAPDNASRDSAAAAPESEYQPVDSGPQRSSDQQRPGEQGAPPSAGSSPSASQRASDSIRNTNVPRKDVFTAADGVFGRGAQGLGDMLERLLREHGEPTAYITGREAGGAFVVGVRYGSGTLHHQIEGDRPVYWTGPSLGFDFGADASKVFVLVYNLHDSEKIFHRYPAAEGNAYVVGGFTASYLRRGDIVLIPVRLGVGARLGINAGYMRFSERNRWLPF
ncbi:MAG: hypothetical protein JWO25_1755 [Alphaproteobacteria bacterium]|nr:hypothetical protein [Alphaproteobacteria bacterium]